RRFVFGLLFVSGLVLLVRGWALASAALRGPPQLDVRLDLTGVAFQMVGVDPEPVLGRVASRLRVPALARPRRLGKGPEERHRGGAHGLDNRERGLERLAVVVEAPRPFLLVVALEDRFLLGQDETDARVAVGLGVGAVANDLVGRPLSGRRAPLQRVLGDPAERRLEPRGAGGVLRDERLTLGAGEGHRQLSASFRRRTFASDSGAKPSWRSAPPSSKCSR